MSQNIEMVEVVLKDDFLNVVEVLRRTGIGSKKNKKLYQSCHLLHRDDKFWIMHFKELFLLDNIPSTISEDDIARRNTIINLLEQWGMIEVVNKTLIQTPLADTRNITILRKHEKDEWTLIHKYKIRNKGEV